MCSLYLKEEHRPNNSKPVHIFIERKTNTLQTKSSTLIRDTSGFNLFQRVYVYKRVELFFSKLKWCREQCEGRKFVSSLQAFSVIASCGFNQHRSEVGKSLTTQTRSTRPLNWSSDVAGHFIIKLIVRPVSRVADWLN